MYLSAFLTQTVVRFGALDVSLFYTQSVWLMLVNEDSCLICVLFLSSKVSNDHEWIGLLYVPLACHVRS